MGPSIDEEVLYSLGRICKHFERSTRYYISLKITAYKWSTYCDLRRGDLGGEVWILKLDQPLEIIRCLGSSPWDSVNILCFLNYPWWPAHYHHGLPFTMTQYSSSGENWYDRCRCCVKGYNKSIRGKSWVVLLSIVVVKRHDWVNTV